MVPMSFLYAEFTLYDSHIVMLYKVYGNDCFSESSISILDSLIYNKCVLISSSLSPYYWYTHNTRIMR